MQNRRLLFAVIIKLLAYSGLLLLVVVFVNSLFTNTEGVPQISDGELPMVSLQIDGMQKGQIRKIRWDNKEVAVLLRQFPQKLTQQTELASNNNAKETLHASIKTDIRSKNREYFVFYNTGDSRNCPLYHSGGEFKDVCSSNKFDETGRELNTNKQGHMIEIPPHYFEQDNVIFGKWQP